MDVGVDVFSLCDCDPGTELKQLFMHQSCRQLHFIFRGPGGRGCCVFTVTDPGTELKQLYMHESYRQLYFVFGGSGGRGCCVFTVTVIRVQN